MLWKINALNEKKKKSIEVSKAEGKKIHALPVQYLK